MEWPPGGNAAGNAAGNVARGPWAAAFLFIFFFLFFFFFVSLFPGKTLPPAAGMDGRHGWGVVRLRLLPPLAVLSQHFGICGDLPVSPPSSGRGHEAGEGSSCGQM